MSETQNSKADNSVARFKGKVAAWWYGLVILYVAVTAFLIINSTLGFIEGNGDAGIMLGTAVFLILLSPIVIDPCVRNYVDFYTDHIRVVFSFMKFDIAYSKINLVKETRNVLASTSASLDRLLIKYGFDETMVSIKDKDGFIESLLEKNPSIQVERKS